MNKYLVNMDGNIIEVISKNERELDSFLFSLFDFSRLRIIQVEDNYSSETYPTIEKVVSTIPTII